MEEGRRKKEGWRKEGREGRREGKKKEREGRKEKTTLFGTGCWLPQEFELHLFNLKDVSLTGEHRLEGSLRYIFFIQPLANRLSW